jgi:type I restriction enzyme R subunit
MSRKKIGEAPARIRKICLDLIDHFSKRIEPNGYKAMLAATSREAAVTYKRELDKLNAPKSKIIMTSHLGEKGKDGTSWDEYFLTSDQREEEADRFKSPDDPNKILNVVDMLCRLCLGANKYCSFAGIKVPCIIGTSSCLFFLRISPVLGNATL